MNKGTVLKAAALYTKIRNKKSGRAGAKMKMISAYARGKRLSKPP